MWVGGWVSEWASEWVGERVGMGECGESYHIYTDTIAVNMKLNI